MNKEFKMIKKNRLSSIDQLRGIAALSVVLSHLAAQCFINNASSSQNSWLDIILKNYLSSDYINLGRFGVILFFIISGYVIPFSFPKQNPIKGFIMGRFFRLYPLFWASLTAVLFLRFYAKSTVSPYDIIANITMIPDFLGSHRILDVYWTLAYEIIFYTIVVIIYVCAGPLSLTITRQATLLCACLSIAISIAQIFGQTVFAGDKIILIGFMFLGSAIRKTQIDRGRLIDEWIILITALVLSGIIFRGYIHYILLLYGTDTRFENFNSIIITHVAAIFLFLGALAWLEKTEFSFLTYMGTISYSLYITHPILMELATLLGLEENMVRAGVYIPIVFVVTVILSVITYHSIEQPFTHMGKIAREKLLRT